MWNEYLELSILKAIPHGLIWDFHVTCHCNNMHINLASFRKNLGDHVLENMTVGVVSGKVTADCLVCFQWVAIPPNMNASPWLTTPA